MSMQRSRRQRFATNQAPATWEAPVAALVAVLIVAAALPLVVQGLLAWWTSGEFAWPSGRFLQAYGGLAHGHFGVGLRHRVDAGLPQDRVMWLLTAVGEILALGVVLTGGLRLRRLTDSGSHYGLASPAQAAQALGEPRLRANAAVIRPDLYAHGGLRRRPTAQQLQWTLQSTPTPESTPETTSRAQR